MQRPRLPAAGSPSPIGLLFLLALAASAAAAVPVSAQTIEEWGPRVPEVSNFRMYGGRVEAITVSPMVNIVTGSKPSHVVVSNEWGGLWKSENGGATWRHLDGLAAVNTRDVGYSSNGFTLVATSKRDNRVVNGGGIWVSSDGGDTWTRPPSAIPPLTDRSLARINGYAVSWASDDSRQVYVGTDYGLAVSSDAGRTWQHHVLEPSRAVDADRRQDAVLSVVAVPGMKAIAATHYGLFRTDDNGATWRPIRDGNFESLAFNRLDVSPVNKDVVFWLKDFFTLFLYEVASDTFTEVPMPPPEDGRGSYVRVSRDPRVARNFMVWVGRNRSLASLTCADIACVRAAQPANWTRYGRNEGFHDDVGDLAIDASGMPAFHGSDGGVVKPAKGSVWVAAATSANGFNSFQIISLAGTNFTRSRGDSVTLYFTTQDNNVWASPDSGVTWPGEDCFEGANLEGPRTALQGQRVTITYFATCGDHMTSNVLATWQAIPNVDLSNNTLSHLESPFYVARDTWIRGRARPGGNREVYVSTNNLANWRKAAELTLEQKGGFKVAGPETAPVVYVAVRGTQVGADGRARLGLIAMTELYSFTRTYTEADVMYLPDGGGLGGRFTEWDEAPVFGVDPNNPAFIIAPDVYNGGVKVSLNGGQSWTTDANLTARVTQDGALLLYDGNTQRMEVTHISFDPYHPERIYIGTRDAGIIVSKDHGLSWTTMAGSQRISYITGFFFMRSGSIIVSSYGRGLWKITPSPVRTLVDLLPKVEKMCTGRQCFLTEFDPRLSDARLPGTRGDEGGAGAVEAVLVTGGAISGMNVKDGALKGITVTAGARVMRYSPPGLLPSDVPFTEATAATAGPEVVVASNTLPVLPEGQLIRGLLLKNGQPTAIISGATALSKADLTAMEKATVKAAPKTADAQPYVLLTTSVAATGTTVLGKDQLLGVFARGFGAGPRGGVARVEIDGLVVGKGGAVAADGTLRLELKVPASLGYGEHQVRVVQGERAASAGFVKRVMDDFRTKPK